MFIIDESGVSPGRKAGSGLKHASGRPLLLKIEGFSRSQGREWIETYAPRRAPYAMRFSRSQDREWIETATRKENLNRDGA